MIIIFTSADRDAYDKYDLCMTAGSRNSETYLPEHSFSLIGHFLGPETAEPLFSPFLVEKSEHDFENLLLFLCHVKPLQGSSSAHSS